MSKLAVTDFWLSPSETNVLWLAGRPGEIQARQVDGVRLAPHRLLTRLSLYPRGSRLCHGKPELAMMTSTGRAASGPARTEGWFTKRLGL